MAKPLKYAIRHTVRFTEESAQKLVARAKFLNIKEPAILIRQLVDEGLALLESEEDATK